MKYCLTGNVLNLEAWLDRASGDQVVRGVHWYDTVNAWLSGVAGQYGITLNQAAALFSVLSRNAGLKNAQTCLHKLLAQYCASNDPCFIPAGVGMADVESWCARILTDGGFIIPDHVPGEKSRNFAQVCADPLNPDAVVIDRWGLRAWVDVPELCPPYQPNGALYARIAADYCQLSKIANLTPSQVQGVVWVSIREYVLGDRLPAYGVL